VASESIIATAEAPALDVRVRGEVAVYDALLDGELAIMRKTCAMLDAESRARRSEFLEALIVPLIPVELALAPGRR